MKKIGICFITVALLFTVYMITTHVSTNAKQEVQMIHVDYPSYETAKDLVNAADIIFQGSVEHIDYEQLNIAQYPEGDPTTRGIDKDTLPYTIYTIHVEKVLKGKITSETIKVKRLGGKTDTTVYELENKTTIEKAKTYVFLGSTYKDTYPSLINAEQGSYCIEKEEADSNDAMKIPLAEVLEILK